VIISLTILAVGFSVWNFFSPFPTATSEVWIDGRKFTLGTFLWRDFMPHFEYSDGSDLRAVILVIATGSSEFPSWIDADRLWVINKNSYEVWETGFTEGKPQHGSKNELLKVARNGPKWETGILVDVVVRLVVDDGRTYLLKASDQLIYMIS